MTRHLSGRRRSQAALLLAGSVVIAFAVSGCSSRGTYVYRWDFFFDSIFRPSPVILNGLWLTVSISVVSEFLGVILGVITAVGQMVKARPIRLIARFYVWLFRGTPLLVQLTFFFYGLSVTGIYTWDPIRISGIFIPGEIQAGIVALGLNEGAYMSEIVRAGILAIDPGQMEAAKSLGMTFRLAMLRIVLPQAARVIVPPLGNQFNNMLKTTSLLVIISVQELYTIFNIEQSQNFAPFEFFLAAAVWYLALTTIWGVIQGLIEKRLGKGVAGSSPQEPGVLQRLFGGRLVSVKNRVSCGGGCP